MTRLHLINKAPDHPRFGRCLASLCAGDSLVLMENAVLAVAGDHGLPAENVMALADDLEARGLAGADHGTVTAIAMPELVALTETHASIINW
ncbi:MAG: sulfurtransferase complex subunit TusB [Marinobacter sp.]|uniref:sulfurtransferase complex subunit TusB n=1 Tax=Marinobacter sp. TaxID=50741 RepID=UPI00299EB73A|nr:sulfurtransferase complex subunit TusB [Marinobacter sp.]MDX1634344.1 sulfurtransferase complex subunit TusB [Marinobacter sp.]